MAWFLFVDESGNDLGEAPYEVLAGIAIEDSVVWKIIQEMHAAELRNFGRRYSAGLSELKGKKILKKKVFRHANLSPNIRETDVSTLAKIALDQGNGIDARHLKALALAKLQYTSEVFALCEKFRCKIFACVIDTEAPKTEGNGLRKDYAYLFERFFYFLEDEERGMDQGIIVFDELEKSKSHILVDQAHRYFKETATGRQRANLILPEPFFVHSDLTTGIQIADLAAYCISWGFKMPSITKPRRTELTSYAQQIARLRYLRPGSAQNNNHPVWSITHIHDLRTAIEKEAAGDSTIKKGNAA